MKNILLVLISISFVLNISGQITSYRIAKHYEKNNKPDKAINWYIRSLKHIEDSLKPNIYKSIYKLSVQLDTGSLGGRNEYLSIALKYYTKYSDLKYADLNFVNEQRSTLKIEIRDEFVSMIDLKKKSNAFYNFLKNHNNSAEDSLILLLYDFSKIVNKNEEDWILFYNAYYNTFKKSSEVGLVKNSKIILNKLLDQNLDNSLLYISPEIPRRISDLDFFRQNYGKKLQNQVEILCKAFECNNSKSSNYDLFMEAWNLQLSIYKINPNLLDNKYLKLSFLKLISMQSIQNGLNEFLLNKNCFEKENICFDQETFYYNDIEDLKGKPLVLNNQLIQSVFLHTLENQLNLNRDDFMFSDPLYNLNKSDSALRIINQIQPIREHISRNYNQYFEFAASCYEYLTFDNLIIADILFKLSKERIGNHVSKKNYAAATSEFMMSLQMFPVRNWNDQRKWFYEYFKSRMNKGETEFMGKEIFIATNIYSTDNEFKELIKKYRIIDSETTLKKNNISPESWTGSTEKCDCGKMSDEYLSGALETMKFYRRYSGLPDSLFFTEKSNHYAQCAALIMHALTDKNKVYYLTHHPKKSDLCYSEEGYYGASRGNLAGYSYSGSVGKAYIDDTGQSNTGHRAWVLAPDLVSYGFGSTNNSNCLVWGESDKRNDLNNFYKLIPFSWPPQGIVSDELIKDSDYWTFALQGADFTMAKIKVILNKKEIPIEIAYRLGGYGGLNYINFEMGMEEIIEKTKYFTFTYYRSKAKKGQKYEISIENVIDSFGRKCSFKYSVEII